MEILHFLSSKAYKRERLQIESVLWWRAYGILLFKIWSFENCPAFGACHFCVSLCRGRKSERIERRFKTQNPNPNETRTVAAANPPLSKSCQLIFMVPYSSNFLKMYFVSKTVLTFCVKKNVLVMAQKFAKLLRSLEQFIRTVKGQNNFWNRLFF